MPLSYLEHARSTRPSILFNGFLFLTIILNIGQTRILSLSLFRSDEAAFSRLFTTTVAVKAVMIVLKTWKKPKWVRWDGNKHSPEETAGLFGLGAFAWLNPLLLTGHKKRVTLEAGTCTRSIPTWHQRICRSITPPVSAVCTVALGNVMVWPER
ncbi:ATPase-like protein [Metarhizium guizhouense ARSEF 977]|uniref:ATPase-like protein n=1 Tax=Metarhizium guizhouense (strain ARSEF 977) TaxID=1276136 RepID=A0A0B4HTH7_METGA|nr:ATPase-like protein [Metarhizium guizhouense ARSEF 977]